VADTSKYPVGIRLTIILGFPTLFWIAVLLACSRWSASGEA
jgi:hypothetical protein